MYLDQHHLPRYVLHFLEINHLYHVYELVELLEDLLQDRFASLRNDSHRRDCRIKSLRHAETLYVEPPSTEEARYPGKDTKLVLYQDRYDMSHAPSITRAPFH